MASIPPSLLIKFSDLTEFFDLMVDALCILDREGRFVFVNDAFTHIFGYASDDVLGKPMESMVFAADRERTTRKVGDILSGEVMTLFENRWVRSDGRVVNVMWSGRWSEQYQVRIAIGRDMTEYKRGQSEQVAIYAISEAAYSSSDLEQLLQRVHHFVGEWLPSTNFLVALRDRATGALNVPYAVVMPHHDLDACRNAAASLVETVMRSGEIQFCAAPVERAGGATPRVHLQLLGVPLRTEHESIGALVIQKEFDGPSYASRQVELLQFAARQIAGFMQRKHMETQLRLMAGHDPLTKLPNRVLFLDRFKAALALAQRGGHALALLFIDLNGFKGINDRHGHVCGDAVLQGCARRLEQHLRASDIATRFGGDEFVVLLQGGQLTPQHVAAAAEKIAATIQEPIVHDGIEVSVSASIGVARYPEHGMTLDELVHHADQAMYVVKRGA